MKKGCIGLSTIHKKRRIMNAKCVLVTGGAGFIGSNFLCEMVPKYPHVRFVNVDVLDYSASLKNVESVAARSNYAFYECNILDQGKLLDILRREGVEWVVHFAAQVIHTPLLSFYFCVRPMSITHLAIRFTLPKQTSRAHMCCWKPAANMAESRNSCT